MTIEQFSLFFQLTSEGLLVFLIHCIVIIGIFLLLSQLSQVSCRLKVTCAPNLFGWSSKSGQHHNIIQERKYASAICLEDITLEETEEIKQDETDITHSIIKNNINYNLNHSPSLENLLSECFINEDNERYTLSEVCSEASQIIFTKIQPTLNLIHTPISFDDQYKHSINPSSRKVEQKFTEVEHTTLKGFITDSKEKLHYTSWSLDNYQDTSLSTCSKLDTDISLFKCSNLVNPSLFSIEENEQDDLLLHEELKKANTGKYIPHSQDSECINGCNIYGKLNFSGCICELFGYSRCMDEINESSKSCISKEILERKIYSESNKSGSQLSVSDDDVPSTSSTIYPENESLISNSNKESIVSSGQSSNRSYEKRFESGLDSSFLYESDNQTVIILQMKEGVSLIHSRKARSSSILNNPQKENHNKFLPQIRLLLEKAKPFRRFSHCLETHKKQKISLMNLLPNRRCHSSPIIPVIKNNQYDALETLLTKMRTSGKFRLL